MGAVDSLAVCRLQQRQLQPLRREQIGAMGAVVSLLGRDGRACTAPHGCPSTGADPRQLQPLRLERIATMGAVGDSQDGMALLGRLGCVGACADALMGAVSSLLETAGQGGMTLPRRLGCVGTHSVRIMLRACLALSARRHPHGRGRQPPGVRQFTAELPPDHEDEKMLRVPGPHGLNEVEPPPGSEPGSRMRYCLPPEPEYQVRVPPGAGPGAQAKFRRSDGVEIAVQPPEVHAAAAAACTPGGWTALSTPSDLLYFACEPGPAPGGTRT